MQQIQFKNVLWNKCNKSSSRTFFETNATNPVQGRSLKQMQQIQFKNFFETDATNPV